MKLQHPNVLLFYGIATGFGYLPAVILPWCEGGNVLDYVRKEAKVDLLPLVCIDIASV